MKFLLASLIAFQSFPALAGVSCSFNIVNPGGSTSSEYSNHGSVNVDERHPVEINSDDRAVRLTVLELQASTDRIFYDVKLERNGRTLSRSNGLAWGQYSHASNTVYDADGTRIDYRCWGSVD